MNEQNEVGFLGQIKSDINGLKEKVSKFKQDFSNELGEAYQDSTGRLNKALNDAEERINTVYPTIDIDYQEVEENYTKLEKVSVFYLKKGVDLLNILTANFFRLKW